MTAVNMKFADVLRMLTCVVEVPRARALVNSVHIIPLNIRLRPKNIYGWETVSDCCGMGWTSGRKWGHKLL